MEQRKIFVLLTQFPGREARVLRWYTGCPYTHVSIGLDEDMNTFYSFVMKGFIVEDINRYNKPGRKPFLCELYSMEVSEETYQEVRAYIDTFVRRRSSLHYSKVGLALSLAGIPWKIENGYICSYFVAEILQKCTDAKLKKYCTLCMPKDFSRSRHLKMVFKGDLQRYAQRFGSRPYPV
jgi:hypothetical protein